LGRVRHHPPEYRELLFRLPLYNPKLLLKFNLHDHLFLGRSAGELQWLSGHYASWERDVGISAADVLDKQFFGCGCVVSRTVQLLDSWRAWRNSNQPNRMHDKRLQYSAGGTSKFDYERANKQRDFISLGGTVRLTASGHIFFRDGLYCAEYLECYPAWSGSQSDFLGAYIYFWLWRQYRDGFKRKLGRKSSEWPCSRVG
jgi:hypothetical protein